MDGEPSGTSRAHMLDALKEHVSKREIAPLMRKLEEKNEQNSQKALKFLSVLDFEIEKKLLYNVMKRLKCQAKLLPLLLSFTTYDDFKFYFYQPTRELAIIISDRILKCKFCPLVGPYTCILSHMAISHNTHVGCTKCAYCKGKKITGDSTHSIESCYQRYLKIEEINEIDAKMEMVPFVKEFFLMLKDLSVKLGVLIKRNDYYAGQGYPKREVETPDTEVNTVAVFKNKVNPKKINERVLDKMFTSMCQHIYGGYGPARFHSTYDASDNDERAIEVNDQTEDNLTLSASELAQLDDDNKPAADNLPIGDHSQKPPSAGPKRKALGKATQKRHSSSSSTGKGHDTSKAVIKTSTDDAIYKSFQQLLELNLQKVPPHKRAKVQLSLLEEVINATNDDK